MHPKISHNFEIQIFISITNSLRNIIANRYGYKMPLRVLHAIILIII